MSGFSVSCIKLLSSTCFFHMYLRKCSCRLVLSYLLTSIHNSFSAGTFLPFANINGLIMSPSATILPFASRKRLYWDIRWPNFELGSYSCEILFVVMPCKNFFVSGPYTIMKLREFSLAKEGYSNADLNYLLTILQKPNLCVIKRILKLSEV